MKALRPLDTNGNRLKKGSVVRVLRIPPSLSRGLPRDQQARLKETVGRSLKVLKFDSYGYAWLYYEKKVGKTLFTHDFGMEPKDLELVTKAKKSKNRHPTIPSSGRAKRRRAA
jgi:hypothetical protein